MAIILFGGLFMARKMDASFKKDVDANGLVIKAVLTGKYHGKGKNVRFKYWYKGKLYRGIELSSDTYDNVAIGDTVLIKIDTVHPKESYIYSY